MTGSTLAELKAEATARAQVCAWRETNNDAAEVDRLLAVIDEARSILALLGSTAEHADRVLARAKDRPARRVVHVQSPMGFGADWDLTSVLDAIAQATDIAWRTESVFGHELIIRDPGHFDGKPFTVSVTRTGDPL